jgi:hypothetical protein
VAFFAQGHLLRGTRSPLTTGTSSNLLPSWSPDGSRVLFASNRGGSWDIYIQLADGSQPADVVLQRPGDQFPYAMLADGTVLYLEIRDLWTVSREGKTTPVRVTPFNEGEARFSPGVSSASGTGWVAYTSDNRAGGRSTCSRTPAGRPGWRSPRKAGLSPGGHPTAGSSTTSPARRSSPSTSAPMALFGVPRTLFGRSPFLLSDDRFQAYQSAPDGRRFLMIRRDEGSVPDRLHVLLNWSGDDDRPAPAGGR